MSFKRTDGGLRLRVGFGSESANQKVVGICRVKPRSPVRIKDPMSPAAGITQLWLERPAIGPKIYQFCWVVLAGWRQDSDADAQQVLLPPLPELGKVHRRASLQVHGKSKAGDHKT